MSCPKINVFTPAPRAARFTPFPVLPSHDSEDAFERIINYISKVSSAELFRQTLILQQGVNPKRCEPDGLLAWQEGPVGHKIPSGWTFWAARK